MVSLDWQCRRNGGVTLVELVVTSETDSQVRIESNLQPVWPPRQEGVPAAGWREGEYHGTVAAGDRLVLGYATPAEPVDPPVALRQPAEDPTESISPRALLRTLGRAAPPRDALPGPPPEERSADAGDEICAQPGANSGAGSAEGPAPPGDSTRPGATVTSDDVPVEDDLDEWFAAVEERVARAEELTSLEKPSRASEAIREAGGIDEVGRLRATLAEDRERLASVAGRAGTLQDRLEAAEIPVAALERVR